MDNLKVIVIGAGMGGLTAGIALKQAGYQVEVYDRVRELRPAGAGISLWSNGVKVLNRLGLGQAIANIGGQMNRMAYYDMHGELLTGFSLQPLIDTVGQRPYPVARTDLQGMLLNAFGADDVRLNFRCVGVEQDENSVTAIFEDGSTATGDVLVAADGTHSFLRSYVLGETLERQYAGYVNWNGLVSISEDLAPADSWVLYVGEHKRASLMPVGSDQFYFFLDVPLPKGTVSSPDTYQEELFSFFKGWAAPVQTLIQRLDPTKTNRIEIHDVPPLQTLVKGRVALLGDAGHSTTPDLGQGGCQALEDALVLTTYLQTTNLSVEDALQRYEAARKDRVADIVTRARKRSDVTHGKDAAKTQEWYEELKTEDGSNIMGAISRTILAGPLG
ncbi:MULTISPECIES: FAD-dependent urate hydroxylase HpxO [unclassified Leptolyngbya]|uniref:FAD-dependent urate hydroxylase HpxO n=1 Tax=unclassified Leptolyngbya TaxID=2650499 RepID=UPI001682023D|nr:MULTISPECIES: FAD-dependent urate hydroxylase HpxO [unclassified Leptolyngbya]MBD1913713.1 FAD-dependent urate hydroxylase HpxO [Leptolyngbya sp. FACHB-8]MBD2155323.1 FAD-dependent urate hydroxylase HpxO [Leptolyngbya sp. FACHB-16]